MSGTLRSSFAFILTAAQVSVAFLILNGSAIGATFDFEELLSPEEPPETTRYFEPDDTSNLDETGRAAVRDAMQAFAQRQFAEAESIARQVTERSPDAGAGWYILGLALANQDQFDDALEAFDAADENFAVNAQPLVIKGDILAFLEREVEAVAAYEQATQKDPSLWQLQERLGLLAERRDRLDEAIARFGEAVEASPPDRLFPHVKLANLLLRQDRPDDAVAVVQSFVDRQPEELTALAALGHVQSNAGRTSEAVATFRTLQERAPDEPSAILALAQALLADGKIDGALTVLQDAAVRLEPDPAIEAELGRVLAGTRDYEAALAAYERGLGIAPDNPALLKGASLVNQRLGNFYRARELAQRLVELRPDSGPDAAWLATLHEAVGNRDAAVDSYEKAIALDPQNWVARNNLAVLILESDPERAVEMAQSALELSDNNPSVRDTLGQAYLAANRTPEAVALFEALSRENPQSSVLRYRHGLALVQSGREKEGRQLVKQALKDDPDFSEAVAARALLERIE